MRSPAGYVSGGAVPGGGTWGAVRGGARPPGCGPVRGAPAPGCLLYTSRCV
ncbi:hypothetical protein [Streptomyces fragilis]|uniref:hypothetical protein n=1 Tax=Streptomyces fragilis TaxID=67301 RepID=UPI0024DE9376|nr:hypothetical protein [Streptomyces fragilis]